MFPNFSNAAESFSCSHKTSGVVNQEEEAGPCNVSQSPPLNLSFSLTNDTFPDYFASFFKQVDDSNKADTDEFLRKQMDNIQILVQINTEESRREILEMWQQMDQKLKEKEDEVLALKETADQSERNIETWEKKANALEQEIETFRQERDRTVDASMKRSQRRMQEQEGTSSLVDPGPMESRVICSKCKIKPANLMFFPCRHVAICIRCELPTLQCPLCGEIRVKLFKVQNM